MKEDKCTIPKGLRELDNIVAELAGGIYVIPFYYPNAEFGGLREYCKREGKSCEEVTDQELKMFGLHESQGENRLETVLMKHKKKKR